jgi:hypothetical protein
MVDPDDWDESYDLDPSTKSVRPRLKVGDTVEMELLLEIGQLRTFGATAGRTEASGANSVAYIKPLAEGLPFCQFRGRILETVLSEPIVGLSAIYDGMSRLEGLMDCGIPVSLRGLTSDRDPLMRAQGLWIEGVSTLWANPARPLPLGRKVKLTIVGVRELPPLQPWERTRVFRIVAVELTRA